jgi:predicted flap endonuclease-1-like 5' DNA nuclease
MDDAQHHRRRRRAPRPAAEPAASAEAVGPAEPAASAEPAAATGEASAETSVERRPRRTRGDAALRGLVGAGPSQLGVNGALRARDVSRPTEDELDAAEREVQLVRRHWKPPP